MLPPALDVVGDQLAFLRIAEGSLRGLGLDSDIFATMRAIDEEAEETHALERFPVILDGIGERYRLSKMEVRDRPAS